MDKFSCRRADLIAAFNQSKFQLRYYSRTYYQVYTPTWGFMPVNRIFCPLINGSGKENYIEDRHGKNILIPGNLYFVPPYLPTRWKLDSQLNFLSIHTLLEILPGVELFSGCSKMLVVPIRNEIDLLLQYLYSSEEENILASQKAGALIYSIQISLLDHYSKEDFWGPLSLRRYAKLAEYLMNHGTGRTSVSEIAEFCGESREGFTRHFTAYTGITPKKIIDHYLIRRCLDLLSSGCSMKETAARLQFSNEFAFSRFFKRLLGESPRNWKNHNPNIF